MKTIDLNLLRVLDAVLAAGSVSAAAQHLHLSVPATSHALARLRDRLGDPLLVRAGRQLVPTPRALALREPLAHWMALAGALVEAGRPQDLASARRQFVVRAPEGIAIAYGGALIQRLRQRMPLSQLCFVPETHDDPAALREARVDLDLGHFKPREPELEVLTLASQAQVAVVRQGHALAGRSLTARRYASAQHVAVLPRPGSSSPVDDALAALKMARNVVMRVPQAHTAALVASRSDLVATLGERIAVAMAPSVGLQVLPLAFATEPQTLIMTWHPRHSADAAHACLRQCLLQAMDSRQRRAAGPAAASVSQRPALPRSSTGNAA